MREIILTQGKIAIVDDEDFEWLSKYKWHYAVYGKHGYAKTRNPNKGVCLLRMHRLVIGAKKGEIVDHINRDSLDNRKSNLRKVNQSQNMMNCSVRSTNTSGYKGVCFDKKWNTWLAHVWKDGKQIYIGSYKDKKDAAKAYNEHAYKLHGEYAKLNDI